MPTSCRSQVRMYVCMCAPHFRALFFGQAGAGSCHCSCRCRRRYLFPCCSHCCCFVLFLRYELLVVPLRTQISTNTHSHTHTDRGAGVACVCHKLFCSFKCIMATRTPLDSLCLLHACAGGCVCVCECVFVCVLACWKPQQSHCTPHSHTHTQLQR